MKLLLRRDQKSSMLGRNPTFTLDIRAQLADDEIANIRKYGLGKTMLYERQTMVDRGSGLLGLASRVAFKMMNLTINVDDLVNGKRVECKDIIEMLAVQEQLKDAAENFKNVLEACAHFGGEEVLE